MIRAGIRYGRRLIYTWRIGLRHIVLALTMKTMAIFSQSFLCCPENKQNMLSRRDWYKGLNAAALKK